MRVIDEKDVYVDDEFLSEEWALKRHSQSLEKLNYRGGMSYAEIVCNIEKSSWREIENEHSIYDKEYWKKRVEKLTNNENN